MRAPLLQNQGDQFESGFRAYTGFKLSEARLLAFRRQLLEVKQGRMHPAVWMYKMRETQTTSDFPLYMADSLDRAMLAGYQEYPTSYQLIGRSTTVADFKTAKRFTADGAEGLLTPINEMGPYPPTFITEGKYEISVQKYGARMAFSFEAMVNDDLGMFRDTPMRFGRGARRTREYQFTNLWAANGTFFSNANLNKVNQTCGASSNNPVLGFDGLSDAMTVLSRQKDADNQPISIVGAIIVYPPNLEIVVQKLRNTTSFITDLAASGGTAGTAGSSETRLMIQNFWGGFNWVMNSQLPEADGTSGRTGWYVFANPSVSRPAVMYATLRGHEQPELFLRAPDAQRIGGGVVGPMDGSFDNDAAQEFKIRDFFGASLIDPKAAVFSDGTGS